MLRLELIHPMIVHFPIVLTICLFALDGYTALVHKSIGAAKPAGTASIILAIAAGIFAVVAYVFGDQAYDLAVETAFAPMSLLERHEELGTFTAFAIGGWAVIRTFVWWREIAIGRGLHYLIAAIEGAFVIGVIVTAYYGGQLVYEHGVAVSAMTGH